MKPQKYLRLSLLMPYALWVVSLGIAFLTNIMQSGNTSFSPITSILTGGIIIYVIGIILWGIPYTLLAVSLWVWSLRKQTQEIIKVFRFAPVLLIVPLMIEAPILNYTSYRSYYELSQNWQSFWSGFASYALILAGPSILYGYLSIGCVYGIYKLLTRLNLLKFEEEVIPPISSTI
jgi:hypothetical protein